MKKMKPINIDPKTATMSNYNLREALNYNSYSFCVTADFSNEEATKVLVTKLEMQMMEGLLRVIDNTLGYIPLQNKIYEKVEYVFDNQSAYNINRGMSALRRMKVESIDYTDTKYVNWLKNRIKYGVRSLRKELKATDYSVDAYEQETEDFA